MIKNYDVTTSTTNICGLTQRIYKAKYERKDKFIGDIKICCHGCLIKEIWG